MLLCSIASQQTILLAFFPHMSPPHIESTESLSASTTKLTHKPNIEGKIIMAKPSLATISFFLLQGQIAKKVTVTAPCNKA
jgi:hypothetical protein